MSAFFSTTAASTTRVIANLDAPSPSQRSMSKVTGPARLVEEFTRVWGLGLVGTDA